MKKNVTKLCYYAHHLLEVILIYFSPAKAQVGIIVLAVLADTATGIWAAKRVNENISSKRLGDIVPKLVVYILLVLLAHGVEDVFAISHARTIVAIGLTAIELMSIDENFKKATGKGLLKPLIDLMKRK